jgi:hypothetical protein
LCAASAYIKDKDKDIFRRQMQGLGAVFEFEINAA